MPSVCLLPYKRHKRCRSEASYALSRVGQLARAAERGLRAACARASQLQARYSAAMRQSAPRGQGEGKDTRSNPGTRQQGGKAGTRQQVSKAGTRQQGSKAGTRQQGSKAGTQKAIQDKAERKQGRDKAAGIQGSKAGSQEAFRVVATR